MATTMTTWKARVYVTLKPGVLDPQGRAVENALKVLGFEEVGDVRVGKYIEVGLEAPDREAALARVAEMGRRLFANPVIEQFRYDVTEAAGPAGGAGNAGAAGDPGDA